MSRPKKNEELTIEESVVEDEVVVEKAPELPKPITLDDLIKSDIFKRAKACKRDKGLPNFVTQDNGELHIVCSICGRGFAGFVLEDVLKKWNEE